jgi:hypothetical protein
MHCSHGCSSWAWVTDELHFGLRHQSNIVACTNTVTEPQRRMHSACAGKTIQNVVSPILYVPRAFPLVACPQGRVPEQCWQERNVGKRKKTSGLCGDQNTVQGNAEQYMAQYIKAV